MVLNFRAICFYHCDNAHAQDGEEDDDIRSSFAAEYLKSSSLGSADSITTPISTSRPGTEFSSKCQM
jgi:hypothetical protein